MSVDGWDGLDAFLAELRASGSPATAASLAALRARLRIVASRRLRPGDHLRRVMDSEDVTDEALEDLLVALPGFRGQSWPEFIKFAEAVLLRRVNINARRHHAARRDVGREQPLGDGALPHHGTRTPSEEAAGDEARRKALSLVAELPETLRDVVRLRLDDLDYDVIAARLGISEETARQRMSRALKLLKSSW